MFKCPIESVYERFQHMDGYFSDPLIRKGAEEDPFMFSTFAMWDAIKEFNGQKKPENP